MKPDFPVKVLLVAERSSSENEQLLSRLQTQGYEVVRLFKCGEDVADSLIELSQKSDLVLLDSESGCEQMLLCIRRNGQTPVMILSEDTSDLARINSFKLGADDYIVKPCNHTEVLLRVGAILKRCLGRIFPCDDVDRLHAGGVSLDRNEQSVHIYGNEVVVTPLEFKLLWLLVFYRGRVLSKAYTWQSVLGRDYCDFDRSVDMHLSRVRKKLSKAGFAAERLKVVRGRGYSFN